jgi:hypothetical protein
MPALSEYTNVYNSSLLMLQEKGFQVWRDESGMYCAERDGWDFWAENPCSLAGLIAIYEFKRPTAYREYWWKIDGEDLFGNLPGRPTPFRSVTHSL